MKMLSMKAAGTLLILVAALAEGKTDVASRQLGTMPDGTPEEIYTLKDSSIEAQIMTDGGIIVSLKVPDRSGKLGDVVLGFDGLADYVANRNNKGRAFLGALIGGYANRMAHAKFALNGQAYDCPRTRVTNRCTAGRTGSTMRFGRAA
jgi:aldose 1-epimerase